MAVWFRQIRLKRRFSGDTQLAYSLLNQGQFVPLQRAGFKPCSSSQSAGGKRYPPAVVRPGWVRPHPGSYHLKRLFIKSTSSTKSSGSSLYKEARLHYLYNQCWRGSSAEWFNCNGGCCPLMRITITWHSDAPADSPVRAQLPSGVNTNTVELPVDPAQSAAMANLLLSFLQLLPFLPHHCLRSAFALSLRLYS